MKLGLVVAAVWQQLGFRVALVAMATACTGQVTAEPAYPPAPPPAQVVVAPAPAPPAPVEEDVDYDAQPPVADIEAYPSVVYGGATVYYVGGVWYRREPRGWARYRVEPPNLTTVRRSHGADPHWTRQGEPRPVPPGAPPPPQRRPERQRREEKP